MTHSDCSELAALYARKAEAGLVDVKFFVGNVGEAVSEIVCGEVLRLEEAIARGDVFPLDFDSADVGSNPAPRAIRSQPSLRR